MEAAGSIPAASATLDQLTHYIIVRRDLPYGVICAMVAHAAGESFYLYNRPSSSTFRAAADAKALAEGGGENPSSGTSLLGGSSVLERSVSAERSVVQFHPAQPIDMTTVVVLGARHEAKLARLERRLLDAGVAHVAIREPDTPYHGALMAIGLVPARRGDVAHHVREYQVLTAPVA